MKGLRRTTAWITLFLSAVAMTAMLLFLQTRGIEVPDVAHAAQAAPYSSHEVVRLDNARLSGEDVIIPLPEGVHREDIRFENHYMSRELCVYIRTPDVSFYQETPLPCHTEKIHGVRCAREDGSDTLCLMLRCDTVYEAQPAIDESEIRIHLTAPSEQYTRIVVLDPVYTDSTDLSLLLARRIQTRALHAGQPVRVYLTRTDAAVPSSAQCISFAADVSAARFLRIECGEGTTLSASSRFNNLFFIRRYGNLQFATDLEKNLGALPDILLNGVFVSEADETLRGLKVPAAYLRLGGLHAGDDALLNRTAELIFETLTLTTQED